MLRFSRVDPFAIAALVSVAAGLFPPWTYRYGNPAGYYFLFLPPNMPIQIDTTRLVLEWALIGGVAFATHSLRSR